MTSFLSLTPSLLVSLCSPPTSPFMISSSFNDHPTVSRFHHEAVLFRGRLLLPWRGASLLGSAGLAVATDRYSRHTHSRIEERDETFQRQSASGWRCRRDRQGELVRIGIQKHTAGQRRATFPEMSQTAALALRRGLRGGIPRTLPRKVEVVAGHHHRIW